MVDIVFNHKGEFSSARDMKVRESSDGMLVTLFVFRDRYSPEDNPERSVYWGISLKDAKDKFLKTGSVLEDGVKEADVYHGLLFGELHMLNMNFKHEIAGLKRRW